ncbi:MAG: hypothetical protein JSV64_05760 [Candidatus Bathyarchaeota archaeon]|nr:MAG: hypothetical protein JSV64_05760 [Candidatus Bathyarchaeota archaeon]
MLRRNALLFVVILMTASVVLTTGLALTQAIGPSLTEAAVDCYDLPRSTDYTLLGGGDEVPGGGVPT